ncbi:hypothetical protein DY000_02014057 [Brassica cretica]|uniref:Allantoinase n=1 Tax=Brassica cretica TaxID=69181 RepID=A0ABQ7DBM1_BRACR|nr:hypothetical protein DY000_02014057 [Brassica cretica]
MLLYFGLMGTKSGKALRKETQCSLLPHDHYWISSKRIVTPDGLISGSVEVNGGVIVSVVKEEDWYKKQRGRVKVIDYGEAVIMPGLVDVHAHLDDPGRSDWEGFPSGTKAAAAGGITTLIDMPLNSDPSTVSPETLKLKSFMCPSGINDFPMTNITHIKEGLSVLAKYKRPLLVHAEVEMDSEIDDGTHNDPRSYLTYLKTRPTSCNQKLVIGYQEHKDWWFSEGAHVHIVHLPDATSSLDLIKEAKGKGDNVTVETCPHYLAFSAEEIPEGDTRFKCSPPMRHAANREKLWEAMMEGDIDMLSSDHSPTKPKLKLLSDGNFLKAWGGISSLQFVLPVTWSYGRKYGVTLEQVASWWSDRPSKLAGLHSKGAIAVGKHADIVVWEPEVEFDLEEDHPIHFKHPSISAYLGRKLSGKVVSTFVRETWCLEKANMLLMPVYLCHLRLKKGL